MLVYKMRGAGAVIHLHSKHAVLATLTTNEDTFKISNFEMIKGIKHGVTGRSLRNSDTLEVPIIENTPSESELVNGIENVLRNYPSCQAVLVRRHGVYVWGKNWREAKAMAECYDYLFELAVDLHRLNLS